MPSRSRIESSWSTLAKTGCLSASAPPRAQPLRTRLRASFDTTALGADVEVMASSETEPPPAHPSPKARRRTGALIAAFVGLQFLIPLTYLTREDAGDERFTWRSLHAPTAPSCETSASLERFDGQRETIELKTLIHQDWVDYVGQGRRTVVDAFLRKQCEADGVLEVELVNRCDDERGISEYNLRCGGERSHQTVRTATR